MIIMIKIYDNNLLIHFAQLSMQYFQLRIIVLKIKLYLNIKPTSLKKNRISKVNKREMQHGWNTEDHSTV